MSTMNQPGWISLAPNRQSKLLSHLPYAFQSGWLPQSGEVMREFYQMILEAPTQDYAPSVAAMNAYIESNDVISYLVDDACQANLNMVVSQEGVAREEQVVIPRIPNKAALLHGFNEILNHPPRFVQDALVGLPFSAWVVGIDPTLSGVTLFGLPMFNEYMGGILQEWFGFLGTPASAVGFSVEGEQWLSPAAKEQYQFDDWKKDQECLPYWTSWNSFFTREFKDPAVQRPIAAPDSNETVIAANDGSLYRWASGVKKRDVFWFKDMDYSIADILSSRDPDQQEIIDDHGLVEMFEGGYVFQTYLNPYNFHRWWVPVNGRVLFDPLVVAGDFFNKLVIPDFSGATTASLPYLAQVNARGIIVIETEDYGKVCCIPLGMSEVSTVSFDESMAAGATVKKGDEMGRFNYGGSSFVIIYQNLPGKKLIFMNADGDLFPENPVGASSSAGSGEYVTNIASKIGQWVDI